MRIDDENKVVWCSEELLDWHSRKVSRATSYYAVADAVDTYTGSKEFKRIFSGSKEFEMYLVAILRGYTFKLEQPQKYYWRKKKEHTVAFEENVWLSLNTVDERVYLYRNCTENNYNRTYFTVQEARDLLKSDFDKFDKVECE